MAESRQWQGKTGGGKFGQEALFFILKHLRVVFLYPILYIITPFNLLFGRKATNSLKFYYRNIWKEGLLKSIGHSFLNELNFGKVVLDKFAVLAGHPEQFNIDIDKEDMDNFFHLLDQEKGIILAGSHIGNFELLGQRMTQDKKHISCVIYAGERQQYQERRTIAFGHNDVSMIPVLPDLSHLFAIKEALDKGEIVAILCDRHHGGRKIKKCQFLGQDAYFPTGTFLLAAQMEVPVLSTFIMKEKATYYKGFMKELHIHNDEPSVTNRANELLEKYIVSLENILKKYPHQWFNFFQFWEKSTNN